MERSSPVDEAVPSATLLDRCVCYRGSVQVTIAIARVLSDEAVVVDGCLNPRKSGAGVLT